MQKVLAIAREHTKTLAILFIVIACMAVGVFLRFAPMSPFSGLHGDLKAIEPDPMLAYTDLEGNTVTLEDFKGKPLLINSWATWMPFSKDELVFMNTLQREYGEALTVLAINRMEDREVIKAYIATYGIGRDALFLVDPGDTFYKAVSGYAMPETILYDADGAIVLHVRGVLQENEIRTSLEPFLK